MPKNQALSVAVVFFIIAVTLSTVIFPDDRLVVKIAMFASGVAFGAAISAVISNRRQTL